MNYTYPLYKDNIPGKKAVLDVNTTLVNTSIVISDATLILSDYATQDSSVFLQTTMKVPSGIGAIELDYGGKLIGNGRAQNSIQIIPENAGTPCMLKIHAGKRWNYGDSPTEIVLNKTKISNLREITVNHGQFIVDSCFIEGAPVFATKSMIKCRRSVFSRNKAVSLMYFGPYDNVSSTSQDMSLIDSCVFRDGSNSGIVLHGNYDASGPHSVGNAISGIRILNTTIMGYNGAAIDIAQTTAGISNCEIIYNGNTLGLVYKLPGIGVQQSDVAIHKSQLIGNKGAGVQVRTSAVIEGHWWESGILNLTTDEIWGNNCISQNRTCFGPDENQSSGGIVPANVYMGIKGDWDSRYYGCMNALKNSTMIQNGDTMNIIGAVGTNYFMDHNWWKPAKWTQNTNIIASAGLMVRDFDSVTCGDPGIISNPNTNGTLSQNAKRIAGLTLDRSYIQAFNLARSTVPSNVYESSVYGDALAKAYYQGGLPGALTELYLYAYNPKNPGEQMTSREYAYMQFLIKLYALTGDYEMVYRSNDTLIQRARTTGNVELEVECMRQNALVQYYDWGNESVGLSMIEVIMQSYPFNYRVGESYMIMTRDTTVFDWYLPKIQNRKEITIKELTLSQNYPNPFNPTTEITYGVPEDGAVKLAVYNNLGQEVKVLVNQQVKAGTYTVQFDATGLPSGMYMYKIESGNGTLSKKMVLMK